MHYYHLGQVLDDTEIIRDGWDITWDVTRPKFRPIRAWTDKNYILAYPGNE
jgi:hypothetical protein